MGGGHSEKPHLGPSPTYTVLRWGREREPTRVRTPLTGHQQLMNATDENCHEGSARVRFGVGRWRHGDRWRRRLVCGRGAWNPVQIRFALLFSWEHQLRAVSPTAAAAIARRPRTTRANRDIRRTGNSRTSCARLPLPAVGWRAARNPAQSEEATPMQLVRWMVTVERTSCDVDELPAVLSRCG